MRATLLAGALSMILAAPSLVIPGLVTPSLAATFVYVSNAEDGDIGTYALQADGSLKAGERVKAEKLVMPMAVTPDKRFLIAAVRQKPFQAMTFAIDPASGALKAAGSGPLADSYSYISLDRKGRSLFGASYGGNQVGVNRVGSDGKVGEPHQVIPTARNAHSIVIDKTNRFVFVPHLGTDQVFQFVFDEASGKLAANTPPVVQMKPSTGPRHIVISGDNRFAYLLNELTATVTTLALDASTGHLKELDSVSILPPDTKLGPGMPRGAVGTPGANQAPRDTSKDVWAADLHLTPNGRFLYASERTSATLGGFRVDGESGKLTFLGSTPTEKQPRGFAIDPSGRFLIASGELSDQVASYAIDAETGALKAIGRYPAGKGANWVEVVSFE
jgi:6-phosphogluconolactonase